tara:strand:- start:172 stop:291 length:120 start_codon:yes stop_codon:yes gene_type:complete
VGKGEKGVSPLLAGLPQREVQGSIELDISVEADQTDDDA